MRVALILTLTLTPLTLAPDLIRNPNPKPKPTAQVYRLFDMYDKDGSGEIDHSELQKLLSDEKAELASYSVQPRQPQHPIGASGFPEGPQHACSPRSAAQAASPKSLRRRRAARLTAPPKIKISHFKPPTGSRASHGVRVTMPPDVALLNLKASRLSFPRPYCRRSHPRASAVGLRPGSAECRGGRRPSAPLSVAGPHPRTDGHRTLLTEGPPSIADRLQMDRSPPLAIPRRRPLPRDGRRGGLLRA